MKDPFVDEVRKFRMEHTRQFNSNLHEICEDLRQFEASIGERVVSSPPRKLQPTRKSKKTYFIFFVTLLLLTGASISAENSEERKKLSEQRSGVLLEMHETRVRLLEEDPELKKIREKIMKLYRELALKLQKKGEMKELSEKLRDIEKKLAELEKE